METWTNAAAQQNPLLMSRWYRQRTDADTVPQQTHNVSTSNFYHTHTHCGWLRGLVTGAVGPAWKAMSRIVTNYMDWYRETFPGSLQAPGCQVLGSLAPNKTRPGTSRRLCPPAPAGPHKHRSTIPCSFGVEGQGFRL